jgi:hypothetical protein
MARSFSHKTKQNKTKNKGKVIIVKFGLTGIKREEKVRRAEKGIKKSNRGNDHSQT